MTDGVDRLPFSALAIDADPTVATHSWTPGVVHALRSNRLRGYFAGAENRLALSALYGLLTDSGIGYRPLVLFGPSGVGKTHLAHGIAHAWKANRPDARIVLTTAIDFARLVGPPDDERTSDRGNGVLASQDTDLLIVDDLDEITEKEHAQHVLLRVLDAIHGTGGRTVVTARQNPVRIASMAPGLRGRIAGGLVIQLAKPAMATRVAILRELSATYGIALSGAACRLLAEGMDCTATELRGALLQLQCDAEADGDPMDAGRIRRFLHARQEGRRPTLPQISAATARYFSVRVAELRGTSRTKGLMAARSTAIYLARELTGFTLNRIGAYFGDRDHTTILHSCQKIRRQLDEDPFVRKAVEDIRLQLNP